MSRQHGIGVAYLAHIIRKGLMGCAGDFNHTPALSVRLDSQVLRGKTGMTVCAELVLVTTGTKLWVSARRDGMRNHKFRTVDIDHVVAELAHLVRKACLVAFHTVFLLMTG